MKDTTAILAILMTMRQETQVPTATMLLLHMPKDAASVALPTSPSLVNSPVVAPDKILPPIRDPPKIGGLLFTTLSAPHNEAKMEGAYCACIHKDTRVFLGGRLPGETPQDYKHHAVMRMVWGSVYREYAASANKDTLPIGQNCPLKPGGTDLPEVEPEAPEEALLSPGIRSRNTSKQPQRLPSQFRDNSEAWERWWERS
jgi:hypothetical protein